MARSGPSGRLDSNISALAGLIASFGRFVPPFEIDRGLTPGDAGARPTGVLTFCFGFQDVPFQARAERRQGRPWLTLTMAVVAGAATLLVHCRPYIDLIVRVANEA